MTGKLAPTIQTIRRMFQSVKASSIAVRTVGHGTEVQTREDELVVALKLLCVWSEGQTGAGRI